MGDYGDLSTISGMDNSLSKWIPSTADVLGLLLHIVLFPTLYNLFLQRNIFGWILLAGGYFIFCLAVNRLKKLQPMPEKLSQLEWQWLSRFDFTRSRPWTIIIGVIMAVTVIMIQADINRLVESTLLLMQNPGEVHEGEVSLYYSFGPGFLWTILGLFYLLVLITKVEKTIEPGSGRYQRNEFLSLLAINSLAILFSAYFASLVARLELTTLGLTAAFVGLLILYSILFDPLRLVHFLKRPEPVSLITYIMFMLYCIVRIVV